MIVALIAAGGLGVRMGTSRRKQFLELGGRPILVHTLEAFDSHPQVDRLVVVVPVTDLNYCRQEIIPGAGLYKPVMLVSGGQHRQESVYNGLQAIRANDAIVLIHDGARPLLTTQLITACIEGAQQWRACIPALPIQDTLKQVDRQGMIERTVSRSTLFRAQTPQAFDLSLIKDAHARARHHGWQATDDAALVERMGVAVRMVEGSWENIKITRPHDLLRAEMILRQRLKNGQPI